MPIRVNGYLIDDEIIRREEQMLKPSYAEVADGMEPVAAAMQLREWARENVIERVLLLQEAERDATPVPPDSIERELRKAREAAAQGPGVVTHFDEKAKHAEIDARLRVERLIAKVTRKVPPPKYKQVTEFYRAQPERFVVPELVRAAHVIKNVDENSDETAALAAMQQVEAELQAGADFAEVADRYSDCPGSGGDLGYFARGQMVPEFDEVVFALETGQVSPIFRTMFGFHIAKLIDRQPARVRGFDEVRAEIEERMLREKQNEALENFVDRLKEQSRIEEVRKTAG